MAEVRKNELEVASQALSDATSSGQVGAAALYVRHQDDEFTRSFGEAKSSDDIFLIASISKPMAMAALMTLHDEGHFRLGDPLQKYIPEFDGDDRSEITIGHLLTHTSGLPDQLPENESLRKRHADLQEFVDRAIHTPLRFAPGSRFGYSSMGILLASELAQRITKTPFPQFVQRTVFDPLEMKHSALGLGKLRVEDTMRCQVENAAEESGAGSRESARWDWNSPYWRGLAAPWGGAHASAPDVGRFFAEFLDAGGKVVRPQTAALMIANQNREGLTPRGLGFAVGTKAASPECSPATFSHSGATGTLAWADPATKTICVVLTTLPSGAARPHPRQTTSDMIAKAVATPR
jgi:CubicO group peptidase (beta-lactamase class C family)